MITRGYCPWCGRDIIPMAHSRVFAEIEWDACKGPRCRGNNLELVTDFGGWVLRPTAIHDKWIGAKNSKKKKR